MPPKPVASCPHPVCRHCSSSTQAARLADPTAGGRLHRDSSTGPCRAPRLSSPGAPATAGPRRLAAFGLEAAVRHPPGTRAPALRPAQCACSPVMRRAWGSRPRRSGPVMPGFGPFRARPASADPGSRPSVMRTARAAAPCGRLVRAHAQAAYPAAQPASKPAQATGRRRRKYQQRASLIGHRPASARGARYDTVVT